MGVINEKEEYYQSVKNNLADCNNEMLFADGFDEALIGIVEQFGRPPVALYDYNKCVAVLMERDGMEEEEAIEFLEYNTLGAYMGENTPCFATLIR